MLDTVLQIIEPTWFEKKAVGHTDVILRIGCIADIHVFVPSFLSCLANIFKRINTIHGKRDFWQSDRHYTSECILTMARIGCKVKQTAYARLIRDTRLESVAQIFVRRYRIVFVIVRTHDVNVGRERRFRSCFRVLLMNPSHFEVCAFVIVGGAFRADFIHRITS